MPEALWRIALVGALVLALRSPAFTGAPARDRDRAIAQLTQALQLTPNNDDVRRDLRQLLQDGFPLIASSDTLEVLQKAVYDNSWQRHEFTVPALVAGAPATRACLTRGLLFSPVVPMRDPVRARLPRDQLELGFRFNRACYAYVFEPATAVWRLRFRCFYVSASLIDVDLRPVVEALAQAFVQAYVIARDDFGLHTRYAADEVVTLWVSHTGPPRAEQHASAPGHLFFYSAATARAPLEWLRAVAHEYGHVALPPLGGFLRADEPYATGLLGEALILTRLAEAPQTLGFSVPPPELKLLAERRLQGALDAFRKEGPRALLTDDTGEAGVSYLNSFVLQLLATHGTVAVREVLAAAGAGAASTLRTADLFTAYERWTRERPGLDFMESATIAEGALLTRWVFVPATRFTLLLAASSEANAAGTVSFVSGTTRLSQDGVVLTGGARTPVSINVTLPRIGWFQLQLAVNAAPQPVRLAGWTIKRAG